MTTHVDRPDRNDSLGDRFVKRMAADPRLRLGTWMGVLLGTLAGLAIAIVDVLASPGLVFLMPLALVVASIAWLSTPPAWAYTAVFGSVVWSVANIMGRGFVGLPAEATSLSMRILVLLALGFFAHQLRRAIESERRLAVRDPLTGLLNRRGFFEVAEREIERSRREHTPVTVAVIDLDDFKSVNDSFGHEAGDAVLVRFSEHVANRLRATDVVARVGGDEFAVLLPVSGERAGGVLESLVGVPGRDGLPDMTCSVGAVSYEVAPRSLDRALVEADEEMYVAKRRKLGVSKELREAAGTSLEPSR